MVVVQELRRGRDAAQQNVDRVAADIFKTVAERARSFMNCRAHGVDGARGHRPQRVPDVGGLRRRPTRVEHDARRVAPAAPVQGPEPVLLRREEHGDAAREQRGHDRRAARRQARRLDAEGRVALVARGVAAAAVGAII